jgi:hypothetical protein
LESAPGPLAQPRGLCQHRGYVIEVWVSQGGRGGDTPGGVQLEHGLHKGDTWRKQNEKGTGSEQGIFKG